MSMSECVNHVYNLLILITKNFQRTSTRSKLFSWPLS